MDTLLEPLQFEFFRHGLLAALMVGALCGLIGVYIVLRGMSYIGHGLSHAAFGGAVVGFTFQLNFYVGAAVVGLIAALLINQITRGGKIKSDAAIGIVTTACFALGVAIISRLRHFTQSFEAALFGNILGVDNSDLMVIGGVSVLTAVVMFLTYRSMLFTTFDLDAAKVFGIRTGRMQLVFACILTMAIIASMNIVGVTMIAATLVVPAVTARLLTSSFSRMLLLSTCIGATIGVAGMYLSYYFNAASGATIVLFGACVFMVVSAISYVKERFLFREQTHRHGSLVHTHRAGPGHTRDSHAHEHDHAHDHPHEHDHEHGHGPAATMDGQALTGTGEARYGQGAE